MPVIFMERSLLDSLTEADIKEIIDENEGHTKYARLEGYYEGDHDILRHRKKDSTAPNNRLVNNMAKYITDTATGYFIGKPVVYSSQNDAYLEALQDIFDYGEIMECMTLEDNGDIKRSDKYSIYLAAVEPSLRDTAKEVMAMEAELPPEDRELKEPLDIVNMFDLSEITQISTAIMELSGAMNGKVTVVEDLKK